MAADSRPKRLLVPEHDQFNPPEKATETVASWQDTTVTTVPGADHFLWGHDQFLVERLVAFAAELTA